MKLNKLTLPAEWEEHEATWIVWPQNCDDWPGKFSTVKWFYCEMVRYLSLSETVRIIAGSEKVKKDAVAILTKSHIDLKNVEFLICPSDRSWIRDSGPFFVFDEKGNLNLVDFGFNAWAKYSNWENDNKIPSVISSHFSYSSLKEHGVNLEGGSIDINGSGTLITTTQCLLNKDKQVRNEGFEKEDYEKLFQKYFGISNTLWLGDGIAGDDTNGHVDDFCRFVNSKTVVLCNEDDPEDENYMPLNENREIVSDMKLEDGSKLEVVLLPLPRPRYFDGFRLPASYANFYISNKYVLVPTFNDTSDIKALGILGELFPDRCVVGISCTDVIWGFGGIHCLTREQALSES